MIGSSAMSLALRELHDRTLIESCLRRDAPMHLYEIGDLDDFFFPHTQWFALPDLKALALLYSATDLPVLLIMMRESQAELARTLLRALVAQRRLPRRFYAHLVPGIAQTVFDDARRLELHGRHDRMVLCDWSAVNTVDTTRAVALGPNDREELLAFYARAYPGNWFDARMLETGTYFGVRDESSGARELAAVAGVHVVARAHRVASLGNIATGPSMRNQGLGRIVTAAVIKGLGPSIDPLGLNVESVNAAAIAVYNRLGFAYVASYDEVLVTL